MNSRYLNGATIMTTPTPLQLEAARDAGFSGIEARAERLLADPTEVSATSRAVRPDEVWSLNGVRIGLFADGRLDRETLEADLRTCLEICRAIRSAYLLIVPPRVAGLGEAAALPGMRDGLELARDQAAASGVKVAFEFLGFFDCPIATPRAAAAAVHDLEDVDLVLDSCHWHASGAGSLDPFPIERVAMVHLNDAPAKPPREIEDADRVLPGQGVIRLHELLAELRSRGYAGPWSLETFNPSYWVEDPASVTRRGWKALEGLL
ncbi:MAG: sugar phosphate isomerase/epimerase family protein [Actinomycetota bacterium]